MSDEKETVFGRTNRCSSEAGRAEAVGGGFNQSGRDLPALYAESVRVCPRFDHPCRQPHSESSSAVDLAVPSVLSLGLTSPGAGSSARSSN
jgi:hypothetical protein